jgi:hypothetical protein
VVRRYAEPVLVGTASRLTPDSLADIEQAPPGPGGYAAASPMWFEWAGRRYHVRAILAHWRERRAWWREVLDADSASDPSVVSPASSTECPSAIAVAARERLVWRVEAGPGWLTRTGVFDLACDETSPGDPAPCGWLLLRVSD